MVVGDVCENPYVLNVILFANEIIKIVYYCLPFALIVLITIDFVKGIINGEEANTKYFMFALKRCICAVGLFLVPSFVDLTMDIKIKDRKTALFMVSILLVYLISIMLFIILRSMKQWKKQRKRRMKLL